MESSSPITPPCPHPTVQLLFLASDRSQPPDSTARDYHQDVAAEAARGGMLQAALQTLEEKHAEGAPE